MTREEELILLEKLAEFMGAAPGEPGYAPPPGHPDFQRGPAYGAGPVGDTPEGKAKAPKKNPGRIKGHQVNGPPGTPTAGPGGFEGRKAGGGSKGGGGPGGGKGGGGPATGIDPSGRPGGGIAREGGLVAPKKEPPPQAPPVPPVPPARPYPTLSRAPQRPPEPGALQSDLVRDPFKKYMLEMSPRDVPKLQPFGTKYADPVSPAQRRINQINYEQPQHDVIYEKYKQAQDRFDEMERMAQPGEQSDYVTEMRSAYNRANMPSWLARSWPSPDLSFKPSDDWRGQLGSTGGYNAWKTNQQQAVTPTAPPKQSSWQEAATASPVVTPVTTGTQADFWRDWWEKNRQDPASADSGYGGYGGYGGILDSSIFD